MPARRLLRLEVVASEGCTPQPMVLGLMGILHGTSEQAGPSTRWHEGAIQTAASTYLLDAFKLIAHLADCLEAAEAA